MDLSLIALFVSIGTLAVSAISPIIVNLINNRHQRRMKEYELFGDRRIQAVEEYLQSIGQLRKNKYGNALDKYSIAYGNVLLFVSEKTKTLMDELDSMVHGNMYDDKTDDGLKFPQKTVNDLCASLRKDVGVKKV